MNYQIGETYWLDRPTIKNHWRNSKGKYSPSLIAPIKGKLLSIDDFDNDNIGTLCLIRPLNINGIIVGKPLTIPLSAILRKVAK